MASAPPDERVYTDFKDEARTCPTNMKFKTTNERIQLWVKALEEIYPDVKLWDYKQKTKQKLVSLKIRDTDNGNLIIKFHLSTGVVVIQGSQYQSWGANEYASIKARVNALSDSGAVLEKPSDQDAVDSLLPIPAVLLGMQLGLSGTVLPMIHILLKIGILNERIMISIPTMSVMVKFAIVMMQYRNWRWHTCNCVIIRMII